MTMVEVAPARECDTVSHKIGPLIGLGVAVALMILSLSAFVVGSNASAGAGILVGQTAANFSAPDVAGKVRTLQEFKNHPVLLVFGTSDDLGRIDLEKAGLPGDTQVLLLARDLDREMPVASVETVLVLRDDGSRVAQQYGVWSGAGDVPLTQAILISASGEILDRGPLADVLGPVPATATP